MNRRRKSPWVTIQSFGAWGFIARHRITGEIGYFLIAE